jgi:predicted ATP-grasp superfamily ATP-dependent carboligase
MSEPSSLVHVVDEVPELTHATVPLVFVHALEGFLDAGSAATLAGAHLAGLPGSRVIASFDIDSLYDYRGRRPPLVFAEDHYEDYEAPRLTVRTAHDTDGSPYLLMTGPEPDLRWEAFATAVRSLLERFGVGLVLGLGSVPMAVPHTRPVLQTTHASRPELVNRPNLWRGKIRVPSSAGALLELRLGEWGIDAMGFVAHVPHYLTQVEFPPAALALIEALADKTGLAFDTDDLRTAGAERMQQISGQIEDSDEVREIVSGLEQQYDAFQRATEASLLAGDESLPTAEELGAEFERFLAGLDHPEDQPER